MVCDRNSTDPIAQAVYGRDRLILLQRGYPVDELLPGKFFRKPLGDRPAVLTTGAKLIRGWQAPEPRSADYRRLSRDVSSNSLSASAAAELSGVLTSGNMGAADAKAGLERANVESLKVALTGSALRYLDVDLVEEALPSLALTELGSRYRDEGQKLFLVTDTLVVTGAVLTLKESAKASALLALSAQLLARFGLKANREEENAHAVTLEPGQEEVAIAVRLLEVDWSDPNSLQLKAAEGKISIRGTETPPVAERARLGENFAMADLDDVQRGDQLFVRTEEE